MNEMNATREEDSVNGAVVNRSRSALSLHETVRVVSRHRKKSLSVFVAVAAMVVLYLVWGPRSYESAAKLFVRIGRESVALDPTATTGQTVQLQVTRTNEINSVLDLLQGRGTAERVVEELTPDFILARRQSNPLLDTWRSWPSPNLCTRMNDRIWVNRFAAVLE